MKILVIDDDRDLVEAITIGFQLQWQDCIVLAASDGESGLDKFFEEVPDIVILDVAMPGLNGFEVLSRIRRISDVPVLMLTARGEEMDRVRGLETGADDYIVKPFSHLELFARIKAALRRAELPPPVNLAPSFASGDLALNFQSRELTIGGVEVRLTPTEYNLLYHLVRNAGRVLTHETLLAKVWGPGYRNQPEYLKVYISRLRSKIEPNPNHPRYILTERGLGYRFSKVLEPAQRV